MNKVMYAAAHERRRRMRRWTEVVVGGITMIAVALVLSATGKFPDVVTTIGAVVGLGLLVVGTTASYSIFLDRDTEISSDFDR